MTIESRELFELCKQLFEKTGWDSTDLDKQMYVETEFGPDYVESIGDGETFWEFPLYTSDYLLKKLPGELKRSDDQYGALWGMKNLTQMLDGVWDASYRFEDEMNPPDYKYSCEADTPLKALLELTMKLHEEGIL